MWEASALELLFISMKGKLILIPTPIDDLSPLEPVALSLLQKASTDNKSVIAVEDAKPGRRRWLHWGLPREAIAEFVLYNEHTRKEELPLLIEKLRSGHDVYLMSDGGLPAFCDPGLELVDACHEKNITVTATPFCNSIALALALSGFNHDKFIFNGFLSAKKEERQIQLSELLKNKVTQVLMDTPYRLSKLISELAQLSPQKQVFLAMNLNHPNELLLRGPASLLQKKVEGQKAEFILVISQ